MSENKVLNIKLKKFYVILFSLIILLIPMAFLFGIISDRESYKNEAIKNIEQSWAKAQVLSAPSMTLTIGKDKKKTTQVLDLGSYDVNVKINTEIRKKGIFKVPVYTADVNIKGWFKNTCGALKNVESKLSLDVTDAKGFVEAPKFKVLNENLQTVDDNVYVKNLTTNSDRIPFEMNYKLRGVNSLSIVPSGTISKIKINGNWKDPSFEGDFLPSKRSVTTKDFSAEWSIPKIATLKSDKPNPNDGSFYVSSDNDEAEVTVSLLTPVDNYRMATRSVKYAFLFLLLTFVAYYVFEITSAKNNPIHPIQYMLIGGALLIFYLLLTSISEFVPFLLAYVVAMLFTVALISSYTYFVLTKRENLKFTYLIMLVMILLYTFLYTLLVIQDLSLLIGSFILFFVIASIMYATRNVDWYDGN